MIRVLFLLFWVFILGRFVYDYVQQKDSYMRYKLREELISIFLFSGFIFGGFTLVHFLY